MRKGQISLVEKAKKGNFPQIWIDYLEKSELPLRILNEARWYYIYRKKCGKQALPEEFDTIIQYDPKEFGLDSAFLGMFIRIFAYSEIKEVLKALEKPLEMRKLLLYLLEDNEISMEEAEMLVQEIGTEIPQNKNTYEAVLFNIVSYLNVWGENTSRTYPISEKIKMAQAIYSQFESAPKHEGFEDVKWSGFRFLYKEAYKCINANLPAEAFIKRIKKEYDIRKLLEDSDLFDKDYVVCDDNNSMELLKNIVVTCGVKTDLTMGVFAVASRYSANDGAVTVTFRTIKECKYVAKKDSDDLYFYNYSNHAVSNTVSYVFYYDTGFLYFDSNKRVSLNKLKRDLAIYGKPFETFIDMIMDLHIEKGSPIFKDVKRLLKKPKIFIPLYFNECIGKHSMKEVCTEKYKKSVPVDWNKGDASLNYLTYMAYPLVIEQDRGLLLNEYRRMAKENAFDRFYSLLSSFASLDVTKKRAVNYFLAYLILSHIAKESYWIDEEGCAVDEKEVFNACKDYVNMSRMLKQKVKLRFRSAKKFKDAHDDVTVAYSMKVENVPLVKIPKKSVFHALRKMLPEEFEWIKTRKRLILEGKNMRHCVASYADKINRDACAIYSFVYAKTQRRYTIEFCKRYGGYYIEQIQGMCDRGCPEEVKDYVRGFLKEVGDFSM